MSSRSHDKKQITNISNVIIIDNNNVIKFDKEELCLTTRKLT